MITEWLEKNSVEYNLIKINKRKMIIELKKTNSMLYINSEKCNVFKMDKVDYTLLDNGKDSLLWLLDEKTGKHYYVNLKGKNNWLSLAFKNCDKNEIYLGKQVLNNQRTLNYILGELVKK